MLKASDSFSIRTILAVFTVILISGCSQTPTKQVRGTQPVSGFLPDPSLLRPGKSGELDLVYRNPAINPSSYNKVLLTPVTLQTAPGSSLDGIPPEQRQALVNTFHTDLFSAISQHCQMVDTPTPATMEIHIAITDATQSDTTANTITTYIPQARMLDTMTGYGFNNGVGNFVGSVTAEGYATDATEGTLLWEGVDRRAGANALGTDTLNSWGDVKNATKAWSEQFAKRLTELGACSRRS